MGNNNGCVRYTVMELRQGALRRDIALGEKAKRDAEVVRLWHTDRQAWRNALLQDMKHFEKCTRLAERRGSSPASRRMEWMAQAMFLVRDHPGLSDAEIARRVGVSPSALSRSKEYRIAATLARGQGSMPRRGRVLTNPDTRLRDIEAIAEHDEPPSAGCEHEDN